MIILIYQRNFVRFTTNTYTTTSFEDHINELLSSCEIGSQDWLNEIEIDKNDWSLIAC